MHKRVRYNGAILTTNIADPGIIFENVPDVCVIFISKFDVFGGGFPLYHIDRIVRETGKSVDNGFHEVYVNTKIKDDSEISELMEVFVEDNAYSNKFPITSGIKRQYKETEGGLQTMCEIMEKIREEGKEEGREEGKIEASSRINKLNVILVKNKRFDDLERSITDPQYQEQLIAELLS